MPIDENPVSDISQKECFLPFQAGFVAAIGVIIGSTQCGREESMQPNAQTSSPCPLRPRRRARKGVSVPAWYGALQSYVYEPGKPVWSGRFYQQFAEEAYRKNVIANRSIGMVARGAASIPTLLYEIDAQ